MMMVGRVGAVAFMSAALAAVFPIGCGPSPGTGANPPAGSASDITFESLAEARAKLAAGATEAPLNADASTTYRRTVDTGAGTETEELNVKGVIVVRSIRTGDKLHIDQDTDHDGTFDWQLDAIVGPLPTDRRVVINESAVSPARRSTTMQTSVTVAHVVLEIADGSGWIVESEYDTTVQQPLAGGITTENCTASQDTALEAATRAAITGGIACMKHYGVNDIHDQLVELMATRSINYDCTGALPGTCAEASVFDMFTNHIFGSSVDIGIGATFGAGGCSNQPLVLFHEIMHLATGLSHANSGPWTTAKARAKDRIYSCADVCMEPTKATKCECATCLRTSSADPRCAGFAACGGFHVSMAITAPQSIIACAAAATAASDGVEFELVPARDAAPSDFEVTNVLNAKTKYDPPTTPGAKITMDSEPELFAMSMGSGKQLDSTQLVVTAYATSTQGGCTLSFDGGGSVPFPPGFTNLNADVTFTFDPTKVAIGPQTIDLQNGWIVTITKDP